MRSTSDRAAGGQGSAENRIALSRREYLIPGLRLDPFADGIVSVYS